MSQFEIPSFAEGAARLAAACDLVVEAGQASEVPDDVLGATLAALCRLHAAKAQSGQFPRAFGRNNDIAITDVAIVCTAMMEAADLNLFDLGAWQSMAGVGRRLASATPYRDNINESAGGRGST